MVVHMIPAPDCPTVAGKPSRGCMLCRGCSAVREVALKVYDRRAIAVEVVSRLHSLRWLHTIPVHEQQVRASCELADCRS